MQRQTIRIMAIALPDCPTQLFDTLRRVGLRLLPVIAAIALTACSQAGVPSDPVPWSGEPYTGAVRASMARPDGGTPLRRRGRGSAAFTILDNGNAQLVVFGAIADENGDAGFSAEGRFDDAGWLAEHDDMRIRIDHDGRIDGRGRLQAQHLQMSGKVTARAFDLVVEIESLAADDQSPPPQPAFTVTYDLSRSAPDDEDDTSATEPDNRLTCRRTRMEPRMIANLGGDAMSMIHVPVCVD